MLYAVLKSTNDLEQAHDVGPTLDVSLVYIDIIIYIYFIIFQYRICLCAVEPV